MGNIVKGDIIPDENHLARYCKTTQIDNGEIQASAFLLRNNEEGLSVNWLEFLQCISRESEIAKIRDIYYSRFGRIGAGAKIAVLNAGETRNKVREETTDSRNLDVIHFPFIDDDEDDSHSEIRNMRPDEELIAELIAETVHSTFPARRP
jgi:hypothetical protein